MRVSIIWDTRWDLKGGDVWGTLAASYVGKVAVQKDILKEQLRNAEEGRLAEEERKEIKAGLILIKKRCGASREEGASKDKRPLFTSPEWGDIHLGTKDGAPIHWEEWRSKTREEQWARLGG